MTSGARRTRDDTWLSDSSAVAVASMVVAADLLLGVILAAVIGSVEIDG